MHLSRVVCACLFLTTTVLSAESKNPADYPLRIHIFGRSETTFYHYRHEDEAKGDGRANLFSNGDVRGVDFNFDCSQSLVRSFGYETYPAKWKKPNEELTVLLPVFGKNNAYFTCNLHTQVKDYAYASSREGLISEPPAELKAWMVKHDYDPEHGKNVPTRTASAASAAGQAPPAQAGQAAPPTAAATPAQQ
jgi:hypothetical protein